jgi:hypothetical protein
MTSSVKSIATSSARAVHHHVEQPVDEEADPALGAQLGVEVPALDEALGVAGRLADRDQCPVGDERADLGPVQVGDLVVGGDGDVVHVHEQMAGISVDLGPLVVLHRVLDGQRVQLELGRDEPHVVFVRVVEVEPQDRLGVFGQLGRDLSRREVLGYNPARGVQTGTDRTGRYRMPKGVHAAIMPAPAAD